MLLTTDEKDRMQLKMNKGRFHRRHLRFRMRSKKLPDFLAGVQLVADIDAPLLLSSDWEWQPGQPCPPPLTMIISHFSDRFSQPP
ncbi:MAG: hypothetical protein V9H25_14650 [Candidatus Competibacter sp.]